MSTAPRARRSHPEVVVAIVSWNTRELLRDCLRSLEGGVDSGRVEVWVVDNASVDGSADLVATSYPWVRLIASQTNLGFGAAVNAVAARTAGTGAPAWLAPANADIALRPGALDALIRTGTEHPHAGIIAPRLILPDNSIEHSVHPFPGLGSTLAVNLGLGRVSPRLGAKLTLDDRWDLARAREVDWAHGAFLLIRRSAFDLAGGFDADQFLYAEDLDIAWRLRQAGWRTRYEPAAAVDHVRSAAIAQLYGDDRDFAAQRSAYAWMLRRRGPALMRACAMANTLGAAVRAAVTSLAAVLGQREVALEAWRLRRQARIHLDGLTASRRALERHR